MSEGRSFRPKGRKTLMIAYMGRRKNGSRGEIREYFRSTPRRGQPSSGGGNDPGTPCRTGRLDLLPTSPTVTASQSA